MEQQKFNILVIDDNKEQLDWFKMLNSATSPYYFHTLQNEINAAQALKNIQPDLVFLDIALNSLDGPLIATILNGNDFDDSKIISMSANPKFKNSINIENFLLKPLTKESVFNKIKEKLNR